MKKYKMVVFLKTTTSLKNYIDIKNTFKDFCEEIIKYEEKGIKAIEVTNRKEREGFIVNIDFISNDEDIFKIENQLKKHINVLYFFIRSIN